MKFTNQEYKDMTEAAWGVTEDQINKFYRYADDSIVINYLSKED